MQMKGKESNPMQIRDDTRAVAPALEKYAQGPIAELWKRSGLTTRDRSIVTLAALIARNQIVEMSHYVSVLELAPGAYQGYLTVTGTTNPATATIPYWFAVPGGDPTGIAILYSDQSDSPRSTSRAAVVFRITDVAGLPYGGSVTPAVVVSAGYAGLIRALYAVGDIPGTYAIDVRTGSTSIQLEITAGAATATVFIPVY